MTLIDFESHVHHSKGLRAEPIVTIVLAGNENSEKAEVASLLRTGDRRVAQYCWCEPGYPTGFFRIPLFQVYQLSKELSPESS